MIIMPRANVRGIIVVLNMDGLNELDEGILIKVDQWLENPDKMNTRTGLQLLTEMMRGVYRSQNELIQHVRKQNGRVDELERVILELKKKNIIRWIEDHTAQAVTILIFIVLILDVIIDQITSSTAIAYMWAIIKKWSGLP